MAETTVRRVSAFVVGLSLFAAACGEVTTMAAAPTATSRSRHRSTRAPRLQRLGSARHRSADQARRRPASTGWSARAGMKGTTPLGRAVQEFQDKLLAIDPELGTTFNYAAETYDAINIIALAAEKARDGRHRLRQGDQRHHP